MLAAYPAEVARYKGGEAKLMGFFVGQVMKRSQGKADPKGVQPVLLAPDSAEPYFGSGAPSRNSDIGSTVMPP